MDCHECAIVGKERPAVALCRFCSVALCLDHLAEAVCDASSVPQYACRHVPDEARVARQPAPAPLPATVYCAARAG